MKRGGVLFLSAIIVSCLTAPALFADRNTEDLQSRIIERFDTADGSKDTQKYEYQQNFRWIVRGSKFVTQGFPKFGYVKTYPQALFSSVPEGADYRAFGVEAAFDRKGYNFLELIPVEDKDGSAGPVPKGIPIPGRVKNLDFWVWGSNHDYYVDIHLQDWRGITHVIRMGSINYKGWQNLKVEIPNSIPQDVIYVPSRKSLELVKIVVWTNPDEKVDGFFVYFDHIKVITDMFETPFDGSNLADPKNVEQLWSQATGTSTTSTSSGN